MIVAQATGADGRPLYILGLSAVNVERMQAGQPISVTLPDDAAVRIAIFGGRGTETDLVAQLAEHFTIRGTVVPEPDEGST